MKIMTPELAAKHALKSLTLSVTKTAEGKMAISFNPLRGWLLPEPQSHITKLIERTIADGIEQATIMATTQGVVSTGFDEAMPSFSEIKELMMIGFEDLRIMTRRYLPMIDDDAEDREVAKRIAQGIADGEFVISGDIVNILPVDKLLRVVTTITVMDAFLGALGQNETQELESPATMMLATAGAPSFFPEEAAEEINELVRKRFLGYVAAEMAGMNERTQDGLEAIEGLIKPEASTTESTSAFDPRATIDEQVGTREQVGCMP